MSAVPVPARARSGRAHENADQRVAEAWRALDVLLPRRPAGLPAATWLAVWAVLHRLAEYARYEVIRPTHEHLAGELGVPVRTLRTYLDHSEAAGLISREPLYNHHGDWKLTRYRLTFLEVAMAIERSAPSDGDRHLESVATPQVTENVTWSPLQVTENVTPIDAQRHMPSDAERQLTLPPGGTPTTTPAAADADAGWEDQPPPNKKPGPCVVCGEWVATGEAYQPGLQDWLEPVHLRCYGKPPGSVNPEWERDLERADRERQAQEAQAACRRAAVALAMAEPSQANLEELTLPDVKEVAAALGISLPPRTRASDYIEAIVEATV